MRELAPGLWHWTAPHPEWRVGEPWDRNVSSDAIDDGERLLLFDPLAVPSQIEELAADCETAIVLTAPWHERDSRSLVERLGPPVYTPLPDTAHRRAGGRRQPRRRLAAQGGDRRGAPLRGWRPA